MSESEVVPSFAPLGLPLSKNILGRAREGLAPLAWVGFSRSENSKPSGRHLGRHNGLVRQGLRKFAFAQDRIEA